MFDGRRILLIFSLLFYPLAGYSGILIEPLIGAKVAGDTKHQGETFGTDHYETGLRLGYGEGRHFAGIESDYLVWEIRSPDGADKEDYSGLSTGVFLGYKLQYLRFFVTYYPVSSMESGFDSSELKGTGYNLGLSVGGENFINVFFKYQRMNFDERVDSSGNTTDLIGNLRIQPKLFVLGLSLPLDL